jgi:hypothetical protein
MKYSIHFYNSTGQRNYKCNLNKIYLCTSIHLVEEGLPEKITQINSFYISSFIQCICSDPSHTALILSKSTRIFLSGVFDFQVLYGFMDVNGHLFSPKKYNCSNFVHMAIPYGNQPVSLLFKSFFFQKHKSILGIICYSRWSFYGIRYWKDQKPSGNLVFLYNKKYKN